MKKYIGVDVGGTSVKGIIISEDGSALSDSSVAVDKSSPQNIAGCINGLITRLADAAGLRVEDASGIGIGCPGLIDSVNGRVVFAGNLNLRDFPLGEAVSRRFGLQTKITNDANAAALGEARFGAGANYSDSILVTLGTGVGGGIVVDGKLFEGGCSAGAEIGHIVIERGGLPCTCGRRGCFESYCSATALIKRTAEAMRGHRDSLMWKTYTDKTVSGKTAFDYAGTDAAAKEVVDWYIGYLACGLTNIANIFRPQIIMLGGGVSAQGEKLTVPLQKLVNAELFGGTEYAPVKIAVSELGNRAGAFGAAALNIP